MLLRPVSIAVPPSRGWSATVRCGGTVGSGAKQRTCRSWLGVLWTYWNDLVLSTDLRTAAFSIRFRSDDRIFLACPVNEGSVEFLENRGVLGPHCQLGPPVNPGGGSGGGQPNYIWISWLDAPLKDFGNLADKRRYVTVEDRARELGVVLGQRPRAQSARVELDVRSGVRCQNRHPHPISLVSAEPWNYACLDKQIKSNPRKREILMMPAPSPGRRPRSTGQPEIMA